MITAEAADVAATPRPEAAEVAGLAPGAGRSQRLGGGDGQVGSLARGEGTDERTGAEA